MFSRTHFIVFTLIFIAFGFLFYLNPEEVEFSLWEGSSLFISPALIAFGAFIMGAFFVFLVTLFVDARRAFQLWRSSKSDRREGKIRERYSDALEEMLKGNIHRAKEMLAKILENRPNHLPAHISLANLYSLEGKYADAIEVLGKAKALEPESLEVLFDLVKNNVGLKRYPAALEILDFILERDASNREALRKKRDIHIIMGSWDEAYQTQKGVVKHTKEKEYAQGEKQALAGMEYKFAEELAQKGDFREAEKALRGIIKEDPAFFPAHVSLGDVLQRQGSFEEAGQTWRKALEASWNPVFLERLESLYLSMAQPQKALEPPGIIARAPGGQRSPLLLQPAAHSPGDGGRGHRAAPGPGNGRGYLSRTPDPDGTGLSPAGRFRSLHGGLRESPGYEEVPPPRLPVFFLRSQPGGVVGIL
jgi:tetratricopeptide (TPR) repeat protein